jgi:hypothetical protein
MINQRLRRIEATLRSGLMPLAPPPRRLQSMQDVIDLLHEQVEAVRSAPWADPIVKARTIAYLAGVACKAIETGVLATRMEMLETVLRQRKDPKSS